LSHARNARSNTHDGWQVTTSTLGLGAHSLTAKEIDPYGDISAASSPLDLTITTSAPSTAPLVINGKGQNYVVGPGSKNTKAPSLS
jgi:hypothetical protein